MKIKAPTLSGRCFISYYRFPDTEIIIIAVLIRKIHKKWNNYNNNNYSYIIINNLDNIKVRRHIHIKNIPF